MTAIVTQGIRSRYSFVLGVLTVLFISRVAGQLLVALFEISWLPPMARWYSGLLPYAVLLPIQIVIVILMIGIVRDVVRGQGYFVDPKPRAARYIKWFSYVYFLSMVVRYVLTMWWRPELRWFTGTIPIWFHMVLAAFLYTFSHYHLRRATHDRSAAAP